MLLRKASVNHVGDTVKLRSDLSLQKWIYPDDLNFARATSVFIGSDSSELEKYRPENKVLDSKQFDWPFNWPRNYPTSQSNIKKSFWK